MCMGSLPKRTLATAPPAKGQQQGSSGLPVLGTIIAVNCGVFGLWQLSESQTRKEQLFMTEHFTVSRAGVLSRPHTLPTASFSHQSGYHLLA